MSPDTARPPPAAAVFPEPPPKRNLPTSLPVPPQEFISCPLASKRSMRFAPSATSTEPSPATASAPTPAELARLGTRDAELAPEDAVRAEDLDDVRALVGHVDRAVGTDGQRLGKRMTPSARWPICVAVVYGHVTSPPGQSARAAAGRRPRRVSASAAASARSGRGRGWTGRETITPS